MSVCRTTQRIVEWLRMALPCNLALLLGCAVTASVASAASGLSEQLLIDAIPVDRSALPIDYPLISGDARHVAIARSLDAAGASLVVEILAARSGSYVRRFELLSISEGQRPLSTESQASLAERIIDANRYLAENAFRPMPLLFLSRWERDLAFNEEFISDRYRIILQHPTGALRIESLTDPKNALDLPRPALPLTPMPTCLDQPIPIQGWFDPRHRIVVLRQVYVPAATCDRIDHWIVERLPNDS